MLAKYSVIKSKPCQYDTHFLTSISLYMSEPKLKLQGAERVFVTFTDRYRNLY